MARSPTAPSALCLVYFPAIMIQSAAPLWCVLDLLLGSDRGYALHPTAESLAACVSRMLGDPIMPLPHPTRKPLQRYLDAIQEVSARPVRSVQMPAWPAQSESLRVTR
jgi:hypothetical protein